MQCPSPNCFLCPKISSLCAEEAAAQEQTGQVEECLKVNLLKIKADMCKKVKKLGTVIVFVKNREVVLGTGCVFWKSSYTQYSHWELVTPMDSRRILPGVPDGCCVLLPFYDPLTQIPPFLFYAVPCTVIAWGVTVCCITWCQSWTSWPLNTFIMLKPDILKHSSCAYLVLMLVVGYSGCT